MTSSTNNQGGIVEFNANDNARWERSLKEAADSAVDRVVPVVEKAITTGAVCCLKTTVTGTGAVASRCAAKHCSEAVSPAITGCTEHAADSVTEDCMRPAVHCSVQATAEIAKTTLHKGIDSSGRCCGDDKKSSCSCKDKESCCSSTGSSCSTGCCSSNNSKAVKQSPETSTTQSSCIIC